ncbi:MAG: formyltransferase family protein [Bacteroidota bacterium]
MSKRIICWVGDAPNHRALTAKIAARYNVVGVVVDKKEKLKTARGFVAVLKKIINKIRFGKIDAAWSQLQERYRQQYPAWPETPVLFTGSINSKEAFEFTTQLKPDLIIVSGTSLIREPMLSMLLPVGIMNLHTGLSPYVKGGPNCTNWCIANNQRHLTGNTIMWLSAGIDAGNVIVSEKISIEKEKSLPAIHLKVMEHAHDLYLRAVQYVMNIRPPYQSVPQSSLGKGTLYLTKMWTAHKKKQLLKNLVNPVHHQAAPPVKTVPLPS